MRKLLGIFTLLFLSSIPTSATTYYVDYGSGSDSNNGTSTGTAWKHAPGMQGLTPSGASTGDGCTGTCASTTINAGDKIILKGGVTWPYTVAPWPFSRSGSSSTSLYGCAGSGCIYIGNAIGAGLPAWNSGTVTSITLKRDLGNWNPASPPTISCSGGAGTGAAASPSIVPAANTDSNVSGFIYHVALTSGGSGYTSAPTCVFVGSGGPAILVADIDRAIFDLGGSAGSTANAWNIGQSINFPNTYAPGLVVSGNYVLISGLEIRNMQTTVNTLGGSNDIGIGFIELLGSHSTTSNVYLHGIYASCIQSGACPSGGFEGTESAIGLVSPYDEAANSIIENGDATFLGNSTQASNYICTTNTMCATYSFGIQTATQTNAGPVSAHGNVEWADFWQLRFAGDDATGTDPYLSYGNEFWLTVNGITPYPNNPHVNARYMQLTGNATLISYNNVVHNQVGGTSSQIQCGLTQTFYYYNEVQWSIGTGTPPYGIDMADAGGTGGCNFFLYNDTMYANNGGSCVNSQSGSSSTPIVMQNNQCITTPSANNPYWTPISNSAYQTSGGSTVQANVQAASVVQSISTANMQGYVASNAYAPTNSSNDTVTFAAGSNTANLTSLCSGYFTALCADINGVARSSGGGWQAGAYVQGGGGGATTLSPSSQAFGTITVGASSSPFTFTASNANVTTATSLSFSLSGPNSAEYSISNTGVGSCSAASNAIAMGVSCTITVTLTPSGTGSRTATLTMTYSGGDLASPQTAALSGMGASAMNGTQIPQGTKLTLGTTVN